MEFRRVLFRSRQRRTPIAAGCRPGPPGHLRTVAPAAVRFFVTGSGSCRSGFSRELLLWPLPLRRQGEAGWGLSRFAVIPKTPLPNPPLPSQGRELELAAEAAPTGVAGGCAVRAYSSNSSCSTPYFSGQDRKSTRLNSRQ